MLDRISFRAPPDLGRLLRHRSKTLRVPVSAICNQALLEHFQIESLLARTTPATSAPTDIAARLDEQGEALTQVGATLQALLDAVAGDTAPTPAQQAIDARQLARLEAMGLAPKKEGRA